jgi:hypothetical protein
VGKLEKAPPRREISFCALNNSYIAPYAPLRYAPGTPPLLGSLRSPPKGGSRAVRARYRSPMPAQNDSNSVKSDFQKTDQTLCHFEKWLKTGQRWGWGMGAAHRSPTQPPEGRVAARGGEDRGGGGSRSLEAGNGPRSPRTGGQKAQIPPTPPPVLLEPESRFPFPSSPVRFAIEQTARNSERRRRES